MNYTQDFIASVENDNTAKVIKHVLKSVDEDIREYNSDEIEQLILNLKPNSPKHIITICHVLGLYAKWLYEKKIINNNNLYEIIQNIDKKNLWKRAKPNARKKFISYEQYKKIINDIESYEEYNALYFKTLFCCIYEGIYSDDMSVIKNLRASDVEQNIITLHNDNGYSYKIKVSNELAFDIKQLASIDFWERPNRYGLCQVKMRGIYSDSVFKVEDRTTASNDSFKFTCYSKLRKIADEYIGYPLLPLPLYTSGIMHRINYLLNKNNITIEEAFTDNSRNRIAHSIISAELLRCNNNVEIGNFREIVKGHIDVFKELIVEDLTDDLFSDIIDVCTITDEFEEGEEKLFQHLSHERNADVVSLAKHRFKENNGGNLFCENCGFNFYEKYGERGADFIEAHHTKPISEMQAGDKTKPEDLIMLCCNCHSMIHLKKPWLTIKQLNDITLKT